MLNQYVNIVAAALALIGSLSYAWVTLKGKAQPNRVSWLLWTIAPSIAFAAELAQHVPPLVTLLTLSEAVGPLLVVAASFSNRQAYWKVSRFDILCGAVAVLAIALWLVTGQGNVAIIFSLVASVFSAIPTIIKAYSFPTSESPGDYVASLIAGLLTILTIQKWTLGNYGFPVDIVLESAVISFLILTPNRVKARAATAPAVPTSYALRGVPQETQDPSLPAPPAPAALVIASPTQTPSLTWQPSPAATSYNVYRGGVRIGSTQVSAFTDSSAPTGSLHYWVTAVQGPHESARSNDVAVTVDRLPPSLIAVLSRKPNSAGWHNGPVTVTFEPRDDVAGIASFSPPVALAQDGAGQSVTGYAMNYAGDSASATTKVNIDQSPPELGEPVWATNTTESGSTRTVSFTVVDKVSGVAAAEYFSGDDPGVGQGKKVQVKGGSITVTFKTNLPPGSYDLYFRAKDAADNWSEPKLATLAIASNASSAETTPKAPDLTLARDA